MVTATMTEDFAAWLRGALAERGMSIRELGRVLYPENPVTGRRMVHKYLRTEQAKYAPASPRGELRQRIADALGVDVTEMPE